MLTYEKKMGITGGTTYRVLLDSKHVGEIRVLADGFQYFPKGGKAKDGGEVFKTLGACKQSLES
jgi:hypothetical protein